MSSTSATAARRLISRSVFLAALGGLRGCCGRVSRDLTAWARATPLDFGPNGSNLISRAAQPRLRNLFVRPKSNGSKGLRAVLMPPMSNAISCSTGVRRASSSRSTGSRSTTTSPSSRGARRRVSATRPISGPRTARGTSYRRPPGGRVGGSGFGPLAGVRAHRPLGTPAVRQRRASPAAIGHRVVHGGLEFAEPVFIDDAVVDKLDRLTPLAPLHQPHNVTVIKAVRRMRPESAGRRLLRHRVSPRPRDRHRALRPARRAIPAGNPPLGVPRLVLRLDRRPAPPRCARSCPPAG